MLSDEEKKAIEEVKHFNQLTRYWQEEEYEEKEIAIYIETILNLIEKQSKEIEELKKQDLSNSKIIANMSTRHFNDREKIRKYEALQDKIKAKIEEYEKQIEKMEKDDIGRGFTLGKEWSDLKAKVEFGQSLLEKE